MGTALALGWLWDGIGNGDGFGTGTAVGWAALAVAAELWGRTHRSGTWRVPACPTAAPQRPWLPHCTHCCPTAAPQLPHGANGGPTAAPRRPQLPHGAHCCPTAPIAAPRLPHGAHCCPTAPIAAPQLPHGGPTAAPLRPQLPHCAHCRPTAPIVAPLHPSLPPCGPPTPPLQLSHLPAAQRPYGHLWGAFLPPPSPQTHRGGVGRGGGGNPSGGYPSGVVGVIPVGVIPSQWLWGAVCPPRPTPRPTQLKAVGALSAVCSPSAPQCNNRAPPNGSHPMGAMGPISPSLQHWGWVPPISPTPWVLWAP